MLARARVHTTGSVRGAVGDMQAGRVDLAAFRILTPKPTDKWSESRLIGQSGGTRTSSIEHKVQATDSFHQTPNIVFRKVPFGL